MPTSPRRSARCPPRCSRFSRSCWRASPCSQAGPCATASVAGVQTEPAPAPEGAGDPEPHGYPREPRRAGRERLERAYAALAARPAWWLTLALAGLLCFVTFEAKGGLSLEPMTLTEIVLTLLAGAVIA